MSLGLPAGGPFGSPEGAVVSRMDFINMYPIAQEESRMRKIKTQATAFIFFRLVSKKNVAWGYPVLDVASDSHIYSDFIMDIIETCDVTSGFWFSLLRFSI